MLLIRRICSLITLTAVLVCSSCGSSWVGDRQLTDTDGNVTVKETVYDTAGSSNELLTESEKPKLILTNGAVDFDEKTVIMMVSLENNPGITALQFRVHYSKELVLQSVRMDSRFGAYVTVPTPYDNPQMMTFMSPLEETSENGLFAVMVFQIADHVQPSTTVCVHARIVSENTFNENFEEVDFEVVNSTVVLK